MQFVEGARGEASLIDEGLEGSFASGSITTVNPRSKSVVFRYDELDNDEIAGQKLAEDVEKSRIRPIPPESAFELPRDHFKAGLKVDVFAGDLWWQGALAKKGSKWTVKCLADVVDVTPHKPTRDGIAASQFIDGNVRPGLDWQGGAFVLRGTAQKWQAPEAAAVEPEPPASPAAEGEAEPMEEDQQPPPAAEAAAAPAAQKGRGKTAQAQKRQGKQGGGAAGRAREAQQSAPAEEKAEDDGTTGAQEEEAEPPAEKSAKRPAETDLAADGCRSACKNCNRPETDPGAGKLYVYVSPKERKEGPFCARCISGWGDYFRTEAALRFIEYDEILDGAVVDPADVDVDGRKALTLAAVTSGGPPRAGWGTARRGKPKGSSSRGRGGRKQKGG